MKNKTLVLALLTLCQFIHVEAWSAQSDSFVKILSFPCYDPAAAKEGSGTFIRWKGEVFVITSSHVLFHGNPDKGFCHSVENREFKSEAQIIAVNAAKGLALLKAPQLNTKSPFQIEDFQLEELADVRTLGYPYSSPVLLKSQGILFSTASPRHILPLVNFVYEVTAHTEFGMSGGALTDSSENKYLGMISHQYIKVSEGQASLVNDYSGPVNSRDKLIGLVISSSEILSWLRDLSDNSGSSHLAINPNSQLNGKVQVSISDLTFTMTNCKNRERVLSAKKIGGLSMSGSGDGAGVGGLLLSGTGDGAGVGGGLGVYKTFKECNIQVSLAATNSTSWPFKDPKWFESLREKVLSGKKVFISGSLLGNTYYPVSGNILHFFNTYELGATPIVQVDAPFENESENLKLLKNLTKDAMSILTILKKSANLTNKERHLLKSLSNTVHLAQADDYILIARPKLHDLINSPSWGSLMAREEVDLITVSNLKSIFVRIYNTLGKV